MSYSPYVFRSTGVSTIPLAYLDLLQNDVRGLHPHGTVLFVEGDEEPVHSVKVAVGGGELDVAVAGLGAADGTDNVCSGGVDLHRHRHRRVERDLHHAHAFARAEVA